MDHVKAVTPHLMLLMVSNPDWAVESFRARLAEWSEAVPGQISQRASGQGSGWPTLGTLLILSMTPQAFPASDFRHPVLTPARLFISHVLTYCPLLSAKDVAAGLLLCTTVYELQQSSKRFFPEALIFLRKAVEVLLPNLASDAKIAGTDKLPAIITLISATDGEISVEDQYEATYCAVL